MEPLDKKCNPSSRLDFEIVPHLDIRCHHLKNASAISCTFDKNAKKIGANSLIFDKPDFDSLELLQTFCHS